MNGNRLAHCTSSYLRQHAANPVHWHPWDAEALALARERGQPILLSIGYSACHWCHVMAHESFEDPATAELMNRHFINIKVDREERPDLDRIYQSAHQLLTGRPGGWPLTLLLTPDDQIPFFAGTYFPRESRHGLPPFRDVLRGIAHALDDQQQMIQDQNRGLMQALRNLAPRPGPDLPDFNAAPLENARLQLARGFDETHGGFGQAHKFPLPTHLARLLHHWATTRIGGSDDPRALHIVEHSLRQMARGGFNDQLGGGFYRYSVDAQWMIPHFEKMLYDNAQLLGLYSDLAQAGGTQLFADTARATADWVIREMQSPEGGYHATLDADSADGEGGYYLWDREEVRTLLEGETYQALAARYGLDGPPNFGQRWHLHQTPAQAQPDENESQRLEAARAALLAARERRPRPARDEKILTAWNALTIRSMARAGRLLDEPRYIDSAQRALEYIRRELWRDGRLLACPGSEEMAPGAYLDDHAYLLDALLELLQVRWSDTDLALACRLADLLTARFQDSEDGGFFFTADDHEALIQRPKPFSDDATPAGNAIACQALLRLGHLLGNHHYLEAVDDALYCAWEQLSQLPQGHCALLDALDLHLNPPEIVILRGTGAELTRWRRRAGRHFAPRRLTLAIPNAADGLPETLDKPGGEGVSAHICGAAGCEPPIDDFECFSARLSETESTPPDERARAFQGAAGSFIRARE
ncbi:MAG: thioredoxin domain-containing protein [Candidatus Sedimenticola endophacoides]